MLTKVSVILHSIREYLSERIAGHLWSAAVPTQSKSVVSGNSLLISCMEGDIAHDSNQQFIYLSILSLVYRLLSINLDYLLFSYI